jgi:hypothetical protein
MLAVTACCALLLLTSPASAVGQAVPPALPALFPLEADVAVEGDGLARLPLPPEVLSRCRRDLSDLRLFDVAGREVPFVVDAGAPPDAETVVVTSMDVRVEDTSRETRQQGREPAVRRETFTLAVPREVAKGGWDLVLVTRAERFVRRARVTTDGSPSGLRTLWAGSVFRLPGSGDQERVRVPLPPLYSAEAAVTLSLEGQEGFFVEPTFRFERRTPRPGAELMRVGLVARSVRREGPLTVAELDRPAGIVPDLLEIGTTTPFFERHVEALDEAVAHGRRVLGGGMVLRVPAGGVEDVQVPLQAATGSVLEVRIEDGDSPALDELTFTAVVRQPVLVFALPPGDAARQRTGVLRFGGGRAHRPRYDVATLRPLVSGPGDDPAVRAALHAFDPLATARARLGTVRDNALFDAAPALAFAMRAGAPLDVRVYSHRRAIRAPASADGLVRIRLERADLARLMADLADLRVVDASGRQWPYLLDREGERGAVALAPGPPGREEELTRYELGLPEAPLAIAGLRVTTSATYFDRAWTVRGRTEDGKDAVLGQGRLVRSAGGTAPLELPLGGPRVTALRLLVADGDDAPLPLQAVEALVVLPHVYVAAAEGEYAIMLGAPKASAPRYDLERARDLVLSVEPVDATTGPLENNAAYRSTARFAEGKGREQLLVWGALVLAIVVLGGLTLRLVRREPSGTP